MTKASIKKDRIRDTFLTEKQLEILRLRGRGYTQGKIARELGTSRENITITEKRARENIERARKTLEAYESLDPITMEVKAGTDVFDIPLMIFKEADRFGIKVVYNTTSLVGITRRKAGEKIIGNKVIERFNVSILRSGRIMIS